MQSVLQAALISWSIPWIATLAIILTALLYLRGWYLLRCAGFPLLPPWRAGCFLSGLLALWIALASPMDVFNGWLLTAHMLQHMVLMMIAPPLILLGAPLILLVRGLPIFAAREFAGPFLNWRPAQRLGRRLTQPFVALLLMGVVMLGWHVPALYELALRSPAWHQFEHACFLMTSLIFWWPVVQPWPSKPQWPRWTMVPYLLIADLQNTALSATLVFADRVLYPSYLDAPHVFGLSTAQDQAAAGAIMWVVGSAAFLVPAVLIAVQCLMRRQLPLQPQRLPKQTPRFPGVWQAVARGLGMRRGTAEAFSFVLIFVAAGLAFSTALALSGSDDDELALRAHQQSNNLDVAVYMPEGTLPVGENTVSVLVQNTSGGVLLDSPMELSLTQTGGGQRSLPVRESEAESPNKLLRSASMNLPEPGEWLMRVSITHAADSLSITLKVQSVSPHREFGDAWPQLVFPGFTVVLLLVYWQRHRHPMPRQAAQTAASH